MWLTKKIKYYSRGYLRKKFSDPNHLYDNKDLFVKSLPQKKILLIGIYLTDYPNQAEILKNQFSKSIQHEVVQKWYAIGEKPIPEYMVDVTIGYSKKKNPKFKVLNEILSDLDISGYDLLIISDDDIHLWDNFIDVYVGYIYKYDLKVAQPARTKHSFYDHQICLQADSIVKARLTNFVEIGPIFSFSRDVFKYFLPFPSQSPMGYGLDYIWPKIAEKWKFNIGIVDATPVDHSYRPQGKTYVSSENILKMQELFENFDNNERDKKISYQYFKN